MLAKEQDDDKQYAMKHGQMEKYEERVQALSVLRSPDSLRPLVMKWLRNAIGGFTKVQKEQHEKSQCISSSSSSSSSCSSALSSSSLSHEQQDELKIVVLISCPPLSSLLSVTPSSSSSSSLFDYAVHVSLLGARPKPPINVHIAQAHRSYAVAKDSNWIRFAFCIFHGGFSSSLTASPPSLLLPPSLSQQTHTHTISDCGPYWHPCVFCER
jgi:hypothetical protein